MAPRSTSAAARVLRESARTNRATLLSNTAAAAGFEIEPVHKMRTAIRRLRGVIRVYADLLDPDWRASIDVELQWLAVALGRLRDLDILQQRLAERLRKESVEHGPQLVKEMQSRLLPERGVARSGVRKVLASQRYEELMKQLEVAAANAPLAVEYQAASLETLLDHLEQYWELLRKKVKRAKRLVGKQDEDPMEAFASSRLHSARKAAKRMRYSIEAVLPVLPAAQQERVSKFLKRTKKLQDDLGEFQDASVTIAAIERLQDLEGLSPKLQEALQSVLRTEHSRAERASKQLFVHWKPLNKAWRHLWDSED